MDLKTAKILSFEFYLNNKVEQLAPLYLNKYLMTRIDGDFEGN